MEWLKGWAVQVICNTAVGPKVGSAGGSLGGTWSPVSTELSQLPGAALRGPAVIFSVSSQWERIQGLSPSPGQASQANYLLALCICVARPCFEENPASVHRAQPFKPK